MFRLDIPIPIVFFPGTPIISAICQIMMMRVSLLTKLKWIQLDIIHAHPSIYIHTYIYIYIHMNYDIVSNEILAVHIQCTHIHIPCTCKHATEHLLVSFFPWGAEHAASSIDGLEVCCPAECPDCSISAWVPEISDPRKQVDFTWRIFDVSLPVSKNYISCLQTEKHHLQVINLLGVNSMFQCVVPLWCDV